MTNPDPCPECNRAPEVEDNGCGWWCNCPHCYSGDPEANELCGWSAYTKEMAIRNWNDQVREWREDNAA